MSRASKDATRQIVWMVRLCLLLLPAAWLWSRGAPTAVALFWMALVFFLLIIPRSCRAIKFDGTRCGNNANGLLGGCHLVNHKWQNFWRILPLDWRPVSARPDLILVQGRRRVGGGAPAAPGPPVSTTSGQASPPAGVAIGAGWWDTPGQILATVGTLTSVAGVLVSILAWRFPA